MSLGKQNTTFIEFLKNASGLHLLMGRSHDEVMDILKPSTNYIKDPYEGVYVFQDAVLFFEQNNSLLGIEIILHPPTQQKDLAKLFNHGWRQYGSQLTPEKFEQLILSEQIACLKTTGLKLDNQVLDVSPPCYLLDHIGLFCKFEKDLTYQETTGVFLQKIQVELMRWHIRSEHKGYIFEQIYPVY